ncbi:Ribosomal RNA small subunit methyltransferase C [Candidatus Ecksteinia adelgidicola]|nr:Ribosomal RNA small subunit methyltransferase C [Candidatus Ecksteinia adelgidicola]
MLKLSPSSKSILRHSHIFIKRYILFAGDLQDFLPSQFLSKEVRVHTQKYHYWQLLKRKMDKKIKFSLMIDLEFIHKSNTLIYYWPKSKQEAQFQLCNIFTQLPKGSKIFIVGENRSGVRSSQKILEKYITLTKIDCSFRCTLYYGKLNTQVIFNLIEWWKSYLINDFVVKTLPGVFSHNGLDKGSALLLSTFEKSIQGKVLNIGCGSGVLSMFITKFSPNIQLTLTDVHAAALFSSCETLKVNNIQGRVIASNVYSNVKGNFNMIISNPPFHNSLKKNLTVAKLLIQNALKHLKIGGRFRIVANSFLPYQQILNNTFGSYEVLTQNNKFKVYQAIYNKNKNVKNK